MVFCKLRRVYIIDFFFFGRSKEGEYNQSFLEYKIDGSEAHSRRRRRRSHKKQGQMALVPSSSLPLNESPVVAEVNMGDDSAAPTVRATVVQASTVFYDTPATLGPLTTSLHSHSISVSLFLIFLLLGFRGFVSKSRLSC